jgi:hypothetical protein
MMCVKLFRVKSMYTMTFMYTMYKDLHMEKFKRVIRHIKLISMHRRLFWMYLDLHEENGTYIPLSHVSLPPYLSLSLQFS